MTFRASSAGLSGTALEVERAHVIEELDAPYEARVRVRVLDEAADPAAMLGKDFTLEMDRAGLARRWTGVVRELRHGGDVERAGEGEGGWVDLWVVPALWFLSLRRDTRIFQDKTALEIVREVLEEGLARFSRELEAPAEGPFPKREYCVQYQESDLAFVSRLLEEEGVALSFSFDGERELVRLTDANAQRPRISNVSGDGVVRARDDLRPLEDFDPVHEFARRSGTSTTSVVVRDHDFTGPSSPESEERGTDERGRDRERYEHGLGRSATIGDYDGGRFGAEDSARQALVRRQMHLAKAKVVEGEGRASGFVAGQRFELTEHPLVGMDGEYLLTRVEHFGLRAADELREHRGVHESGYVNRFTCIPADTPHRPWRRTPKPSVPGHETAIVTGPAGDEIHTDLHGRVKVQFHWDRKGQRDERSSCFLRVRQAWAGAGFGFVFIPRVGMEVIVSFANGDPDRPYVTGAVYGASHLPPYTLPDEKTKSTIKTRSTPQSPSGYNELRFEDAAGREEIFTHAQKDQNEVVLSDHTTGVGGDQENIVAQTQTQQVHQNQSELVKGDQTMEVGSDRRVHVAGSFSELVDAGEKRLVKGGVTEVITGFEFRKVTGQLTDSIKGGEVRSVLGGVEETITGAHTQDVDGPNTEVMLAGSTQTVTAGPITYQTGGLMTLKSGGPITLNGLAGIEYVGLAIKETTVSLKPHFDPFAREAESTKSKQGNIAIDLWSRKGGAYGLTAAVAGAKVSVFAFNIGHYDAKISVQGLKVDMYGEKKDKSGVTVAPLAFEFSL
jgi:type VI secretion system secreted protein VgrG